jgi:hypothetical protein
MAKWAAPKRYWRLNIGISLELGIWCFKKALQASDNVVPFDLRRAIPRRAVGQAGGAGYIPAPSILPRGRAIFLLFL